MPDTPTPEATPPVIDQAALDAAVRTALDAMGTGDGARTAPPALNADAGEETRAAVAPTGDLVDFRAIPDDELPAMRALDLPIEEDPKRRAFLGHHLFRLFSAQSKGRWGEVEKETQALARRGFYGDGVARDVHENGARALSTLTESDGGVFIPEVVYNEVLRIVPTFGVIRRIARVIPNVTGKIKIPNLAAGLVAFWLGEGQEIKARKPAFGSVSLDPEKIGLIVPWTSEVQDEVGASLLNLIVTLIAEAFAKLEDQTALYGDGTAAYGGVTGLASAAGVIEYRLGGSATSGKTTFGDLHYDDLLSSRTGLAPGVRNSGTYVFHPDSEITLSKIKDNDGQYLLKQPNTPGGFQTLNGRPVVWAEAAYADGETGVGKVVGFYGDFDKFIIAQGRQMTSTLLTEATITDVDDATDIRLGAQDMRALRMTERLDMLVALPTAFVKFVTADS